MMNTQASYMGIVVKDVAAATEYYRDVLGLPVDVQRSIPGRFTRFDLAGDAMLALQAVDESPDGQRFEPALTVDDVDGTYAAWQAKGVELLEEPHDMPFGRTFLFRTPEGHILRAYRPHMNN